MNTFNIISFTHRNTGLKNLSSLYIDESELAERLTALKYFLELKEILYLATCNRIEFHIVTEKVVDTSFLHEFFHALYDADPEDEILRNVSVFSGEEAVLHIFKVASSLDSVVVGEREITSQVRKAYETCRDLGLTGDMLRLVVKFTITTAKEVFTDSKIALNPVSVVSLAYRTLTEHHIPLNAKFLIIGAGETNRNMSKYLLKHGYKNFTVFNRSIENANTLADELKGKSYDLDHLKKYQDGFDVIISCTGSTQPIITDNIYESLSTNNSPGTKMLIDLAMPRDFEDTIITRPNIHYIDIATIKNRACENRKKREAELIVADEIINRNIAEFKKMTRIRKVELAMQEVPKKIKEIKQTALETVFSKDFQQLDAPSREVVEKILNYMEKNYIKVPMKMAKEILLEKE
ncbi:MAG: glutamyl-tRNA reductase [Bacteroidia bacterium]